MASIQSKTQNSELRTQNWNWNWLGLLPFLIFAALFLLGPAAFIVAGTFTNPAGNFTLDNLGGLTRPDIVKSYVLSIEVSAVTAVLGGLFGFLLAWAVVGGGVPRWVRGAMTTFSGVASNFAGVPLAFAFIATLGRTGFITALLKTVLGWDLYSGSFSLYSFWGLTLTYLYFQFPLMVLIMTPALEGLRREWREAAENLGAQSWQYWRYVALPILLPSLLGTTVLLFGNAFGAYATAYALTGGALNLVPIQIGAQIRGDVLHDPNLGYALAFGMMAIMGLSIAGYTWLQSLSARWLR